MAKLSFRYGAMNSSKTANALMQKYNYEERGMKALLVKPSTDIRDGTLTVKSRIGLESEALLFDNLNDDIVKQHDVVIIDEVQFLNKNQINYLSVICDDLDINVFCYGLRTDFQGNLFEGSKWLLAIADKIEELKTTCWCGAKATHNARINEDGEVVKHGEQIELGRNDKYISLCRKHFVGGLTCY